MHVGVQVAAAAHGSETAGVWRNSLGLFSLVGLPPSPLSQGPPDLFKRPSFMSFMNQQLVVVVICPALLPKDHHGTQLSDVTPNQSSIS